MRGEANACLTSIANHFHVFVIRKIQPHIFYIAVMTLMGMHQVHANPDMPSATSGKVTIRVTGYTPWAWNAATRARRDALNHWLKTFHDPATGEPWGSLIRLAPDNQLKFPGFSLKLLNFAAGTGEEVIITPTVGVQEYIKYRDQRFLLPLNPYIWKVRSDKHGNPLRTSDGAWDYETDDSGKRIALWPDWDKIPEAFRTLLTTEGDVFGLPVSRMGTGLMYRRDMFEQAGIDPDRPPKTWDELFHDSLKITAHARGTKTRYGFALTGDLVDLYVLGAGGESAHLAPSGANNGKADDRPRRWMVDVDSPERIEALRFFRRCTLTKWIAAPDGDPVIVWTPDVSTQPEIFHTGLGRGKWDGDPAAPGSRVVFEKEVYSSEMIHTGIAFNQLGGYGAGNTDQWFNLFAEPEGRLAMNFATPDAIMMEVQALDPSQVGFARIPAGKAGAFVRAEGQIGSLNYALAGNPQLARKAWAVLSFLASGEYSRQSVHSYVNEGEGVAETLDPQLLAAEGYGTISEQMPPGLHQYWDTLEESMRAPIAAKNFETLLNQYLQPIYRRASLEPNFDYVAALHEAQREMQARLDFLTGDNKRGQSHALLIPAMAIIFGCVLIFSFLAFRGLLSKYKAPSPSDMPRRPAGTRVAYSLLSPAMLLIVLFNYYPILRALPIAFQDYHVIGGSQWTGLANFNEVFGNPATWSSLIKTFYYLSLTISAGFFAPVVLAILMSEIFSLRYMLRTLYYLPTVVAGVVMLLMWQRFYEPTPDGMVNKLVIPLLQLWNHLTPAVWNVAPLPLDWLHDSLLGIPSVVFVGIWGSIGPGMLIYLAALKSIPEEIYEAAEIDGAGWRVKFVNITLSYLRPLLVINFIGAVIGAFQASGNILALAGNFPATYTFAVHIWFQAFGLGEFGTGTALSWLMAMMLMGFTVWQLRVLRNVEFRKAAGD